MSFPARPASSRRPSSSARLPSLSALRPLWFPGLHQLQPGRLPAPGGLLRAAAEGVCSPSGPGTGARSVCPAFFGPVQRSRSSPSPGQWPDTAGPRRNRIRSPGLLPAGPSLPPCRGLLCAGPCHRDTCQCLRGGSADTIEGGGEPHVPECPVASPAPRGSRPHPEDSALCFSHCSCGGHCSGLESPGPGGRCSGTPSEQASRATCTELSRPEKPPAVCRGGSGAP